MNGGLNRMWAALQEDKVIAASRGELGMCMVSLFPQMAICASPRCHTVN